jgi:glycosyltransferase involved in cell wall biosynthesis
VISAGAVPDTAPYYAMADVLVLPSHREGLPTVVLEAQAAGRPVVGACATGIVDVISDGETGLLFPVGDVAALAGAIARILTDKNLALKLGLAGQEQVKHKFQQQKIWDELYRAYLAVLQKQEPLSSFTPYTEKSRSFAAESNK